MAGGGKSFQDREKASLVRGEVLDSVLLVLSDKEKDLKKVEKWSQYKKDIIMKMATNVLPRLTEVTGEEGKPLIVHFDNAFTDDK